jgi:hypothetical protein
MKLVGGSHETKEHGVIRHEQDVFQDGRFSSTCRLLKEDLFM